MNELELRTLFGIVQDPDKNVLDLNNRFTREEIQRIIRIFQLNKKQKRAREGLAIKCVNTLELVQSNN